MPDDGEPKSLSIDTTAASVMPDHDAAPTSPMARPPTPGRGPLSSHPTTPAPTNDRFSPPPPPDTREQESHEPVKADSVTATTFPEHTTPTKPAKFIPLTEAASAIASKNISRPPSSHLRSPVQPVAAVQPSTITTTTTTPIKTSLPARKAPTPASAKANASNKVTPLRRNSTGVRKLLSLTSLRSSFTSSPRNSPPTTNPTSPESNRPSPSQKRPSSSSIPSNLSPAHQPLHSYTASVVSTPTTDRFAQDATNGSPGLRRRKSAGWFRRASVIMLGSGRDGSHTPEADGTDEKHMMAAKTSPARHPTVGRKEPRMPEGVPPTLPEIEALESAMGKEGRWGEDMFDGIGR